MSTFTLYIHWCQNCGECCHDDTMHSVHGRHGSEARVCDDCLNNHYSPCENCGDDRYGCFALVKTYNAAQIKPWLLFTCEEEVGGIGAHAFADCFAQNKLPAELATLKCLVEIDRRGADEAVFYDSYNPAFEEYIEEKGFKTAFGSFSDISVIAPELGIAAVNLSAGYYNAHRLNEYIVRSELEHTIQRVVEIVADSTRADFSRYEYDAGGYSDDYYDYLDETIEVPNDLPADLHEIYTAEQLDEVRQQYGNHVLWQLYCDEFGYFSR